MKTRTVLLVATLVLAVCVVGCGRKTPDKGPSGPAKPDAKVTLCVLVPTTGPDAERGKAFIRGLELGINALGKSVDLTKDALLVKDIADDPTVGRTTALNILESEKPTILLGLPDSRAVQQLTIDLKRTGVPLLTCTTDDLNLPVMESCIARLTHPDSLELSVLADHLFNEARARQAIIVADSNDASSLDLARAFRTAFQARTGAVGDQFSYGPAVNPARLIRMVMRETPDMLFLALNPAQAVEVIDQARKATLTARIAGPNWYTPSDFGSPAADYTSVVTTGRDLTEGWTSPALEQLKRERTIAEVAEPLTEAELAGFDAIIILANTLNQARTPEDLALAISQIKDLDGTRGAIAMHRHRILTGAVNLLTIDRRSFRLIKHITLDQALKQAN